MSDKVRASHVLLKHKGSRNPVSRRTGKSTVSVSREEAGTALSKILEDIKSGRTSFAEAAKQYSDCGSFKEGGDLGLFGPGEMMKPFDDATRALKIGEISGLIDTDSGVHIILRTA